MTRTDNRSRLHIDRAGNWRLYAGFGWPMPGWQMLGTVRRGLGDTGALGLSPSGVYCQINAGAVRSLSQKKVIAALDNTSELRMKKERSIIAAREQLGLPQTQAAELRMWQRMWQAWRIRAGLDHPSRILYRSSRSGALIDDAIDAGDGTLHGACDA